MELFAKGLTILRYPRGLGNKGLITPKNVNSACIRTVFKIYKAEILWVG